MAFYEPLLATLKASLSRAPGKRTRTERTLRYIVDLVRHCTRELNDDNATQMAAALTYRTIFSLVPTVVLSLLVFRAFVKLESATNVIKSQVYQFLNISAITADSEQIQLSQRIDEIIENAYRIDYASVGSVGLLLLIWAALALIITVEQSFNRIYDAPTGRTWTQRIMLYWGVLTLGPVLAAVSVYVAGTLVHTAEGVPFLATIMAWLSRFAALGASWLLLLLLYALLPNTKVKLRSAATGALVAAILWEFGKWGFGLYVRKAVGYSALYGSLGLIPLFLFWLYLTWLIVLFGLELTYTLHMMKGQKFKGLAKTEQRDVLIGENAVLLIMATIAQAFDNGKIITATEIAQQMNLPLRAIHMVTHKLRDAGLIHQVEKGDEIQGFTLAQPPSRIPVEQLLNVAQKISLGQPPLAADEKHLPGRQLLADLLDAQRQAAKNKTLSNALSQ
jgi:membrane protein